MAKMSGNPAAAMAVRRSGQVYYELASRRETIGCGYAYVNPGLPDMPDCNFVGEVVLEADADPVREVQEYYASREVRCWGWAPAATQNPDALGALLAPLGLVRHEAAVLEHDGGVARASGEGPVRVLGARAMRRAYTRVLEAVARPGLAGQFRDQHLERLNEPQYDGFVALVDDEAVGAVSLLQVGEIGRICDLMVSPAWRGRGVGGELLSHAVRTAQRWLLRPVCAAVWVGKAAALDEFTKAGFARVDTLVSYWAAEAWEACE